MCVGGRDSRSLAAWPVVGRMGASRGDTVFSETALAADELVAFAEQGVYWLDLGGRTRSEGGSPLTEELALFIGRYGIRLIRISG